MNYPLYEARNEILSNLKYVLSKLNYKIDIKLELPPDGMGDFAFPCFSLAPIAKKSPNDFESEFASIQYTSAIFSPY